MSDDLVFADDDDSNEETVVVTDDTEVVEEAILEEVVSTDPEEPVAEKKDAVDEGGDEEVRTIKTVNPSNEPREDGLIGVGEDYPAQASRSGGDDESDDD